jgi:hypothetical protein
MNQHRRTTITTKILTLCAAAGVLMAHGGFDHVVGTIAKADSSSLTVKTAKGDVSVKLTDKTEITQNDQKFNAADLKPGLRVVVDVPEGSKDMTAHSVKVGAGAAHH